jgi:hypothetical protein
MAFTYYRYVTDSNGIISGSPELVTVNDTDADGNLTDSEGGNAETFTIAGDATSYSFNGGYPVGSNATYEGDFMATTGSGVNTSHYFFSHLSNLSPGFDANSQTGFSDTNTTTVQLTCFLAGTHIATEHGETTIESLNIGDRVRTVEGDLVPVKWIGRQSVHALFSKRERSYPIRVAAGALGGGLPSRDLHVSPDHAFLIDGLLINASALVNGISIVQLAQMPARFDYFHIEVEGHRVILAEGAPTETFVDNVSRRRFHNWVEYEALYPNAQPIREMDVPRVSAARLLPPATRARLLELASGLSPGAQVA